ncbi:MAG: helix-turn-helix domain-containing protein [Geothermobacteraceae bacterium]
MKPQKTDRKTPRQGPGAIPVAAMVESIVGCKWSVRLLELLEEGVCRPSDLMRASPGLSDKVMHERLHKFERFGIVARHQFGERPPVVVEYRLTPFGTRFGRILEEVKNLQAALDRNDVTADRITPER